MHNIPGTSENAVSPLISISAVPVKDIILPSSCIVSLPEASKGVASSIQLIAKVLSAFPASV
jgi:hypothetical protein